MSKQPTAREPVHQQFTELADTAAKATRVVAAVGVVGASIAAPTGLSAVAVGLGLVSAPAIVTAAPVLVGVATGAAALSATASLYSRWKKRQARAAQR